MHLKMNLCLNFVPESCLLLWINRLKSNVNHKIHVKQWRKTQLMDVIKLVLQYIKKVDETFKRRIKGESFILL